MINSKELLISALNDFNSGELLKSKDKCHQLLKNNTLDFDAIHLLGVIEYKNKRLNESIRLLSNAIKLQPQNTQARFNLAKAFREVKKFDEAIKNYKIVCIAHKNDPQPYIEIGLSYSRSHHYKNAILAFEKAIELGSNNPDLLCELGIAQTLSGYLKKAKNTFTKLLENNKNHILSWMNLAIVFEHYGDFDEAILIYNKLLTDNKNLHEASKRKSLALLTKGDLKEGWFNYGFRYLWPNNKTLHDIIDKPYWKGESLEKNKILVWTEQGLGDEILFGTIIYDLVSRNPNVTIACSSRLLKIFKKSFPHNEIINKDNGDIKPELIKNIKYQGSLTDIAKIYRPDFQSFKNNGIYLKNDINRTNELKIKYLNGKKIPIIGISWRSANISAEIQKSIPLVEWEKILTEIPAKLISLQYGDTKKELENFRNKTDINIYNDPNINTKYDLTEFANQVAAMDLIISISNTTVHTAGALGIPTWAIIAKGTGRPWYWFAKEEKCLWYKSVKIYNQKNSGDWLHPFIMIKKDLKEWVTNWKR